VVVSNLLGCVASGDAALAVLAPAIESFALLTNGYRQFRMNWTASNTVAEASIDFTNWQELPGLGWTTNSLEVRDPETNALHRFYRTKLP